MYFLQPMTQRTNHKENFKKILEKNKTKTHNTKTYENMGKLKLIKLTNF